MDILEFAKKIANKLSPDDYNYIGTHGVVALIRGYGFPKDQCENISDEIIDKLNDILLAV